MNENYYDVRELSKMFDVAENTIRNYFKAGIISAKKLGKAWHAKESDIREFLDEGKTTSKESK